MTAKRKRKINYLGFLSLLALIPLMGLGSGNSGLLGFLGFAYYLRYFFVLPDEGFRQNFQRAATLGFMSQLLSLVPLMGAGIWLWGVQQAIPAAFGLSFAVAILVFSIALQLLEWREQRGMAGDQ